MSFGTVSPSKLHDFDFVFRFVGKGSSYIMLTTARVAPEKHEDCSTMPAVVLSMWSVESRHNGYETWKALFGVRAF